MEKIDLRKQLKELYNTGAKAKNSHFVEVPQLQYIMVDGTGDPNTSQDYQDAVGALYATAYGVKFASKGSGLDFVVMPLEGLWWADPPESFAMRSKSEWLWTAMILQPDHVTETMVDDALSSAVDKGKVSEGVASKLRLETLEEGLSAQVLYIGPYANENETIAALHEFAVDAGHSLRGKHHEIYLSDPRRVAPEKLKTIIRQPVL